jgi:predicted tellurium resistance membrane protein TerC
MRYEQFDEYAFDTVAGYIAPKMLGCLGIGVLGMVAFGLIMWAVHDIDWIAIPLAILAVTGFLPGMVYLSTRFDEWHNRKQVDKKRGRR